MPLPNLRMRNPNMVNLIVMGLFAAIISLTTNAFANEKYPVSPMVSELKLERVGDILFRYVEFFESYPCLRLETFEPISRKPIDRKEVCKFQIDHLTVDVRNDVAAVFYKHLGMQDKIFNFSADISMKRARSHYLTCKIVIADKGKLSEPVCKEEQRPPELDEKR